MMKRDRPWMAECEIEIMASLFETQRPVSVLEWGAGGSTVYWPPRYDFIEQWVAVEHQEQFYFDLLDVIDPKVDIRLTSEREGDYCLAAMRGNLKYNLIIVDGIHRQACMVAAVGLLAERGIVVLHDAGRKAYRPAWEMFARREVLYPGEIPAEGGGYKHRGIAVFWQDQFVKQKGWCRDYARQV